MPGFNGTGPRGMGPMTGGGRGFCNPTGGAYGGYPVARGYVPNAGMTAGGYGYPRAGLGMGPYGMGMGRGMGIGRGGFGRGGGRGRGRW